MRTRRFSWFDVTLSYLSMFLAVVFITYARAQAPKPATTTAAPEMTADKRIEILTLSNQKHVIQEQIYQVQIQFLQSQSQAQGNLANTQQQLNVVQSQLDKAEAAVDYDKTKYTLDSDTATFHEKLPKPGDPGTSWTPTPAPTPVKK